MNATLSPMATLHLAAAVWVLVAGGLQLSRAKGTMPHRVLGWSWMCAISVVALSSFWLHGVMDVFFGFSLIHLLSLWVLFCVAASIYFVKAGNIRRHRRFAAGAYIGAVVAGLAAFMGPNRFLHQWLFGT